MAEGAGLEPTDRRPVNGLAIRSSTNYAYPSIKASGPKDTEARMAEVEGLEPSGGFPHRFSGPLRYHYVIHFHIMRDFHPPGFRGQWYQHIRLDPS